MEVHCETDLARNAEFRSLVKDITLQIASEAPQYVSTKDVPDPGQNVFQSPCRRVSGCYRPRRMV